MKKRNILGLLLIALCIAAFVGYCSIDRLRTDTTAPQIHMDSQPLELSVEDPWERLLQGITATDDRDGDVTDSLIVEQVRLLDAETGKINVTIAAFDGAGNSAKAEREAYYSDYVSPKFSLSSDLVFEKGSDFEALNVITAKDALDGVITHRIRATSVDADAVANGGDYAVRFKVFNSLGDTVELVLPVTVVESGLYNAELTLTSYLVYLNKGDSFDAEKYLDAFMIGTEDTSLREGMPPDFNLKTTGHVNTGTPGIYKVSYKVTYLRTDSIGSAYDQSYTGYSELIVIVEG